MHMDIPRTVSSTVCFSIIFTPSTVSSSSSYFLYKTLTKFLHCFTLVSALLAHRWALQNHFTPRSWLINIQNSKTSVCVALTGSVPYMTAVGMTIIMATKQAAIQIQNRLLNLSTTSHPC